VQTKGTFWTSSPGLRDRRLRGVVFISQSRPHVNRDTPTRYKGSCVSGGGVAGSERTADNGWRRWFGAMNRAVNQENES